MKDSTLATIEAILLADPTVAPDLIQRVKAVCAEPAPRPGLRVTARRAAQVLECHPRTVARYARQGKLSVVRLSRRRIRYLLPECEKLANEGVAGGSLEQ